MNAPSAPPPNPYSAPAQPIAVGGNFVEVARGARPTAVIVAVVVEGLTTCLSLISSGSEVVAGRQNVLSLIVQLALGGALVRGLWTGNRLAWQWCRILGILGIIVLTMSAVPLAGGILNGRTNAIGPFAVLVVFLAWLLTTVIALSTRSSFVYFRLVCPQCGKKTTSAADFLFRKAKCKGCAITF